MRQDFVLSSLMIMEIDRLIYELSCVDLEEIDAISWNNRPCVES